MVCRDVRAQRGASESLASVGNSCVTRCDLIRALSWLCVKCADSVGAGVMFEAGALCIAVFCLVCRDVRSQCGTPESLTLSAIRVWRVVT